MTGMRVISNDDLDWQRDAACAGVSLRQPHLFEGAPGRGDSEKPRDAVVRLRHVQQTYCNECSVSGECLLFGLSDPSAFGIYGGKFVGRSIRSGRNSRTRKKIASTTSTTLNSTLTTTSSTTLNSTLSTLSTSTSTSIAPLPVAS